MSYQWRFDVIWNQVPVLLNGLLLTIVLALAGFLLSTLWGLAVAVARMSPSRALSLPARAYINFFRGTPFLVQLLWIYYALPMLTGLVLSSIETALLGLTLNLGAFMAETFRAGIASLDRGQTEAALALGMSRRQVLSRIVLPQAIRRVVPPLASYWVSTFKDTSLFALVSVAELTYQAQQIASETFRPLETFTVLAVTYFLITYPQARAVDYVYHRYRTRT